MDVVRGPFFCPQFLNRKGSFRQLFFTLCKIGRMHIIFLLALLSFNTFSQDRFRQMFSSAYKIEDYHPACPFNLKFTGEKISDEQHLWEVIGSTPSVNGEITKKFKYFHQKIKLRPGLAKGRQMTKERKCYFDWGVYCYGINIEHLDEKLIFKITSYALAFREAGTRNTKISFDLKKGQIVFHFDAKEEQNEFACQYLVIANK